MRFSSQRSSTVREIAHAARSVCSEVKRLQAHTQIRGGLCTARKTARSVRRNPKDFWLVELRRLERA